MAPETVAALIEDAAGLFPPTPDLEITLEANPTSVERAKLEAFRRRWGEPHLARRAVAGRRGPPLPRPRALRGPGGGRPGARPRHVPARQLRLDLRPPPASPAPPGRPSCMPPLGLCADHLSLYQLTIEPGTAFEALHRGGGIVLPDDNDAALLYRDTVDACAEHGLLPYEVSNLARPGAESRHNLAYWRYADYAGIGPGAHGPNCAGRRPGRHAPPPRSGALGGNGGGSRPRQHRRGGDRAAGPRPRDADDGPASGRGHRCRRVRAPHRDVPGRRPGHGRGWAAPWTRVTWCKTGVGWPQRWRDGCAWMRCSPPWCCSGLVTCPGPPSILPRAP